MKARAFTHAQPRTLEQALALKAEHGADAVPLAGGQSLVPAMNLGLARPAMLLDLNRIPGLGHIRVTGDTLSIGALTRYRAVLKDRTVDESCPILAGAVPHIGHTQVLSRGTIGGSLAHADPAAEIPCVILSLDATLIASSARGSREIAARDFFQDYYATALEPTELLTEVRVPIATGRTGWSFQEFAHRRGDYAIVAVSVLVWLDASGRYERASVAMAAVDATPIRLTGTEGLLVGQPPSDELWASAADAAAARLDPPSDSRAPAAYRRHLARVLLTRALGEATARATPSAGRIGAA
jgi:carbon-monoxide dehydrogenase medium subunit